MKPKFHLIRTSREMEEIWGSCAPAGFSKYEVSTFGNTRRIGGELFKPHKRKDGYLAVCIKHDDGRFITIPVHRLVAFVFLPLEEGKTSVDHKNRIRDDNRLCNLHWASGSEQAKNRDTKPHVNGNRVQQYTKDGILVATHISYGAAAKAVGVTCHAIRLAHNRNGTSAGFYWRHEPDPLQLEGEEWRPVPNNNLMDPVEASSMGRIRDKTGIRHQSTTSEGYLQVNLRMKDGTWKSFRCHRLVALAFYGVSDKVVNHISGKPKDNHVGNLEFCTQRENVIHAYETGLIKRRRQRAVIQRDLEGKEMARFPSVAAAAKAMNVSSTAIGDACKRGKRTKRNYTWEYAV